MTYFAPPPPMSYWAPQPYVQQAPTYEEPVYPLNLPPVSYTNGPVYADPFNDGYNQQYLNMPPVATVATGGMYGDGFQYGDGGFGPVVGYGGIHPLDFGVPGAYRGY